MQYQIEETPTRIIVIFRQSDHDRVAFGQLRPADLEEFCTRATSADKRLVFDLGGIHRLFSGDVGDLLNFSKSAKQQGIDFRLRNFSPEIRELFELMRLHNVIQIDDDEPSSAADHT